MSLSIKDQAKEALERSNNILIVPAQDFSGDSIGSAFALGASLEKQGKSSWVMLPHDLPERLSFMPRPKNILQSISTEREFSLTLNTREIPVKDLRYEQEGEKLKIYLTTSVELSKDHLVLEGGNHRHDLIVTVSAPDLEALGDVFTTHPQIFTEVPLLNIDHQPSNERFGKINLVDLSAATTAEVIMDFLTYWSDAFIDEFVATMLLAGILDGTKSFQGAMVSPRTLTAAAQLISRGAKREDIVRHLYKSREIGYLKLWGRIMGRLEFAEELGVAYAGLFQDDFGGLAPSREVLQSILEDLRTNFGSFPTIALSWQSREKKPCVSCLIATADERLAELLTRRLSARRFGRLVECVFAVPAVSDAERMLLETITSIRAQG